jgi:glycosyltransferase involved in cell wall biosynthesis
MPVLSIIIPTLNRGRVFKETVTQVLRQRLTDIELVVVDQSDEPLRGENEAFIRALDDARVRYVFVATKNLPNARNEGLTRVSSDIVLFLDDDVILLADDFLDAHVEAFRDPAVGGVTGRTIERAVVANSLVTAMHVTWGGRTVINLAGTERCAVAGLKGANMSFRASLFQRLGGFDRNFVGSAILEDVDFSFRVAATGATLLFEPKAEMVHLSAPGGGVRVSDAIARESWRFQMTCYFVLKHRGIAGLVPFALTFGLIGLVRVLRWRQPEAVRVLWAACARAWSAWKRGPDETLSVPRTGGAETMRTAPAVRIGEVGA